MKRVAIIGLGLIGGSLAMALKRARPAWSVIGCDRDEGVLTEARRRAAVDEVEPEPRQAVARAEVVVLASRVGTIAKQLRELASAFQPGTLVTDVGSTKRRILEAARSLPTVVHFVGGHPMAGKERSGLDAAQPDLFQGAPWVLVARKGTPPSVIEELADLVRAVGAMPKVLDAASHDRAVAVTSHLPQLLALVLSEQASSVDRALELAGPTFRDLARLGSSPFPLWQDIFSTNRDMVLEAVAEIEQRLREARRDLDRDGLARHFEAARRAVAGHPRLSNRKP